METISVLIGNSDNKLTQIQWANFVFEIENAIKNHANAIHFTGGSSWHSPWQNACFVFEIKDQKVKYLFDKITVIRTICMQDSVAIIRGKTEFI